MKFKIAAAALLLGLVVGGLAVEQTLASPPKGETAAVASNTIRVVEHPGYFETKDEVFQIKPGSYTFQVTNLSGKDAGFVLQREGQDPVVLMVKQGRTENLEVALESGSYTYSCPIIPTPPYPLLVK